MLMKKVLYSLMAILMVAIACGKNDPVNPDPDPQPQPDPQPEAAALTLVTPAIVDLEAESGIYTIKFTTNKDFLTSDFMVVADARFTIWRGLQFNVRWQYSILPVKRDWTFRKFDGYEADANGVQQERWTDITNNCYNHSISVRLIWQF